ncbi:MAG: phosphatidylglycerophosphatase [Gammaproteobacteria bacterium RIFCSPHIGHO2_12_FULL_42_13]|nr:MAG: phosphatidylglycerophosphatase [Gammaproteobacteria bacterium RIFCSPHIGHO2_12_FULL_42_13]
MPSSVWKNPLHFIACGFGVGAIPFLPGTFGTLLGIPIILLLTHFSTITYGIICTLLFFLGILLTGKTNHDFKTEDHPAVVFDEVATFPVVLLGLPVNWQYLLMGFVLFRIFDILKPWPISWVDENIHDGFGVMLDDLLAALATLAVLHAIYYFI